MCKKYIIFTLLVSASCAAIAQEVGTEGPMVPELTIKFSPLHLLNFYPTFQIAVEKKIGKQLTGQLETGVVLDYGTHDGESDFANKRGYKIKTEAHYYLVTAPNNRSIIYLAAELYRNSVNFDRDRWTEGCIDLNCNFRFSQLLHYTVKYRESGINIKMGSVGYGRTIFVDWNWGLGVRFIDYDDPTFVGLDENNDTGIEIINERDRVALSPVFGMRICYRIR